MAKSLISQTIKDCTIMLNIQEVPIQKQHDIPKNDNIEIIEVDNDKEQI